MNPQQYLQYLLTTQVIPEPELNNLRGLRDEIENLIRPLHSNLRFYYAGSYGKQTMIRQKFDLDIVVYWPSLDYTSKTIKEIYDSVGSRLKTKWQYVNSKTVCWEIPFQGGFHIDVVPGRAIDNAYKEANLYRTDTGYTMKTSIKTHIDTVRNSGRRDAIRLLKLWRERKSVPFKKSFLLEWMTIEGSKGCSFTDLPQQLISALTFIRDNIQTIQVKDPANSNNSLSDDISPMNKTFIRQAADTALRSNSWEQVFS